ncbi:MAG: M20/M25/M40 family metallo-hydrolase [Acidimicrobiales bacterium]
MSTKPTSSALLRDLTELVAIPSVSAAPPECAMRRAAAWVARRLNRAGVRSVTFVPGTDPPVVIGEHRVSSKRPTLLLYGHYDVAPVGDRDRWPSPPFEAARHGAHVVGRGATDDKGPLIAQIHAAEDLIRGAAQLTPVNLRFLYEGAEEIGSRGLRDALAHLDAWLRPVDAVVACDSQTLPNGQPTLICSLRGEFSGDLTVIRPGPQRHSGRYGGLVPSPAAALAAVVSSLHTTAGHVALPGFYDGVDHLVPGDVTRSPAIVVTGLHTPGWGPGPRHIIPTQATAKLNVRLVDRQHPAAIEHALAAHARRNVRPPLRVDYTSHLQVRPWRLADRRSPELLAATRAISSVWGIPPAFVGSGGSIPAVPLLEDATAGAAMILCGFGAPSDQAHGAPEKVSLARLERTRRTIHHLAVELGHQRRGTT